VVTLALPAVSNNNSRSTASPGLATALMPGMTIAACPGEPTFTALPGETWMNTDACGRPSRSARLAVTWRSVSGSVPWLTRVITTFAC
jgi:hypothetical protein